LAAASLPSVDRSTANSLALDGGAPSVLTETVRATRRQSDSGEQRFPAVLRAASPGLFPTIQAAFTTGRPFGEGNNANRDHVAVIGLAVANQLGIISLANRPSVFIGDEPFEVLGIVGENTVKPELVNAVLLPTLTAEELYETTDPSIEIRTSVNATNLAPGVLSEQIQLALANAQPGAIGVTKPSGLTNAVRDKISSDLNSGFTFLTVLLIALTIATISISTSSAVEARRYEIGLRRALGASRKHIRQQIIIEASLTGVVAAIIGTLTGLLAVLYWSHHNQWHVVQDRITIPAALLAGPLLGILGGIWPAWKASRQEPADTLRSS
jgi:putative ABC transport system permease protein